MIVGAFASAADAAATATDYRTIAERWRGDRTAISERERGAFNAFLGDEVHHVVNSMASDDAANRWHGPYFSWIANDREVLDRLGVAYRLNERRRADDRAALAMDIVGTVPKAVGAVAGAAGKVGLDALAAALGVNRKTILYGGAALAVLLVLK